MTRLLTHAERFGHLYDVLETPEPGTTGALAGWRFVVKDNIALAGRTTMAGSTRAWDARPARRSAAVVERLEAAGARAVATAAMDELAHGFTTLNEHHPACRNPHDPQRIAGGSSGGSAVAVALGDVPLALGTDTNGSVRVPASLCGVVGFKPGFGRVGVDGVVPFARSLDHLGWFTRSVAEARQVLDVLVPSSPGPQPQRVASLAVEGYAGPAALAAQRAAARALGCERTLGFTDFETAMSASLIITAVEAAEAHLDTLREHPGDLGRGVRTGLAAGLRVPGAAYVTATRFRQRLARRVGALLDDVDVLLLPTTPVPAPLLEQEQVELGGDRSVSREPYLGIFTAPFSLLGLPAVSVPVPTDGLPLGVQLVARHGAEHALLDVAARLEEALAA